MAPLEIAAVVGVGVAVAAIAVAAWQTVRARITRQAYRQKCASRGRYLVDTVRELTRSTSAACRIKDQHIDELMASRLHAIRPLRELSDQLQAIQSAGNELVRLCERMNLEHREEFGAPIFWDIKGELARNDNVLLDGTQPSRAKGTAMAVSGDPQTE